MSEKNDKIIKDLLKKIQIKKYALGTKKRSMWKTNGVFKTHDNLPGFNINTVSNTDTLVKALAFLINYSYNCSKAAQILGVNYNVEWDGFPVQDWEDDFKTRIVNIQHDKKNNELISLEHKLNSLVSEEAKTENELENISSLLQ